MAERSGSVLLHRPATHITATGSDTLEKNDIDPAVLQKADLNISDLTGVAVRGIQIAKAVHEVLRADPRSG